MKYITILIMFFLVSCSAVDDPKLPGDRLDALSVDEHLEAEKSILGLPINISEQLENRAWISSDITNRNLLPQNIKSSLNFNKIFEFKLHNFKKTEYDFVAPIIVDNIMYHFDGLAVNSYNLSNNGQMIWTLNIENDFYNHEFVGGGIICVDNILYLTYGNKEIIAIDSKKGSEVWRRELSNISRVPVSVFENYIFALTIDNKTYKIDRFSGNIIWKHEGTHGDIKSYNNASVTALEHFILSPYSTGEVFVLHSINGNVITKINLIPNSYSYRSFNITNINISPVIDMKNRRLYLTNSEGMIVAINLDNGETIWQKDLHVFNSFWLNDDYIYMIVNDKELLCLHNDTGKVRWVLDIINKERSEVKYYGPIMLGNKLLITTSKGDMIFVSPVDAKIEQVKKMGNNFVLAPMFVDNKLYLLDSNGTISVWQ